MSPSCLCWYVFLLLLSPLAASSVTELEFEDSDTEWGSGFTHLLSSFPADSPFLKESTGESVNCSQRFQLPPSPSSVCWKGDPVGSDEFEKTRLLLLQNRAALQEVTSTSGLASGETSFDQQARNEAQGVKDEYAEVSQTAESIQKVFMDLEEKRKDGKELYAFSSLKELIESTTNTIAHRERTAALLENHVASLERSFNTMKFRLEKLISQ